MAENTLVVNMIMKKKDMKKNNMKKLIILIGIILMSINLQAQDTAKYKADMSLGLNLSGGNNPFYGGNIKTGYSYEKGPWEFGVNPSFLLNYASVDETTRLVRREGYTTASLSRTLDQRWKILFFSEADHSYIRKINLRYSGGIGPGYKFESKKWELQLSEVLLTEGLSSENSAVINYFVLRASSRVKIGIKTKYGTLSSVTVVQPALYTNQGIGLNKHFILRSQNKIEVNVTKTTTVGFNYDANYQSYPAYLNTSVKPFDWNTSFFLLFKISK